MSWGGVFVVVGRLLDLFFSRDRGGPTGRVNGRFFLDGRLAFIVAPHQTEGEGSKNQSGEKQAVHVQDLLPIQGTFGVIIADTLGANQRKKPT